MPFTEEEIQQVWEKRKVVSDNPNVWRKDAATARLYNKYMLGDVSRR